MIIVVNPIELRSINDEQRRFVVKVEKARVGVA
jgi:hypothetical protein